MGWMVAIIATALLLTPTGGPSDSQKAGQRDLALLNDARTHDEIVTDQQHSFVISTPHNAPLENASIRIEMVEGESINPRLTSSGAIDCSSLKSIVDSVVTPGMTDEQKALALWRFVMNCCYIGRWGTSNDGLEHLNVYGYGYCGTFAAVLEPLWWAADLKARHLNIGNHAATEVYYDNDWHYLDANRRCYFLEKDNMTIASLDDLNRMPELWSFRRDKKIGNIGTTRQYYMTMHPNGHGRSPAYSNDFTMAKGDVLLLTWQKQGKWCLTRGEEGGKEPAPEPTFYGNGLFRFHRDFANPTQARSGLVSSANIDWDDAAVGYIHPEKPKTEASLVYRVKAPYFMPEATLSGAFLRKGFNDAIEMDISTDDGKRWVTLWHAEGTGTVRASATTAQTQQVTMNVSWKYSYLVRLRMRAANSPRDVGAYNMESATVLVFNTLCLPALHPGDNKITFSDGARAQRVVKLSYSWNDALPIRLSTETPLEGEEVAVSARVTNMGSVEANNVPVVFFLGNPLHGGVEFGKDLISRISPGGSGLASVRWKATRKMASTAMNSGAELYVVVDPGNQLAKTDKNNNVSSRIVKVLNPPDIRIPSDSFIRFESVKERPQALAIIATVRNLSNSAAHGLFLDDHAPGEQIIVKVFDGDPAKGGREIGRETIQKLLPLEHRNILVQWNIEKLRGVHKVYVQVDPPANLIRALRVKKPSVIAVSVDLDTYRGCKGI